MPNAFDHHAKLELSKFLPLSKIFICQKRGIVTSVRGLEAQLATYAKHVTLLVYISQQSFETDSLRHSLYFSRWHSKAEKVMLITDGMKRRFNGFLFPITTHALSSGHYPLHMAPVCFGKEREETESTDMCMLAGAYGTYKEKL